MIRIYFDVVLTVVADTLYRLLAKDLKRFEDCTPKTIFSDFINCRCIGEVVGDEIIIKMKKKATREFALIGYHEQGSIMIHKHLTKIGV